MTPRRRGEPPASSNGELELFTPPPPRPARASEPPPRRASAHARPEPPRHRDASGDEAFAVGEAIPGATPASAVSIMAVTQTAQAIIEGAFTPLWVRGEVSDFKAHRNGHWYFCLRDDDAQLRCVVWSRDRRRIPAPPDDGMQVAALGQLTVYAARGEMQFTVLGMEAEGDGLWRKALERTRARLEADGLLHPLRKRPIPRHPRRIAVITSRDGAALHDIAAVVRRRCPSVEIVLVPASVQGDLAPESLCYALDQVARWGDADVLIMGRGGGAREDLWAFNDERVARALAACPIPTISAVGHEIDVSICDLVADLRAATPSAAAEAAVPMQAELRERLRGYSSALAGLAAERVWRARDAAGRTARQVTERAVRRIELRRLAVEATAGRLHALSPLATLDRGYTIARTPAGKTVRSVNALSAGDPIDLVFRDGVASAGIERVVATAAPAIDPPAIHSPSDSGAQP